MTSGRGGALLDANMLLLAVSSTVGFRRLRSFSRLQMFVESDIPLLSRTLAEYAVTVTTSYVLAETSNLANKLTGQLRLDWYSALAKYSVLTEEAHVSSKAVGKLPEATRFGITDAALCALAETYTVITLEYRLSGYLEKRGLKVINFNHLRSGIAA